MTLLICPVRPGDSNEELRYAMRSWETNLILPDLRLLTVGYCPTWMKPDWHLKGNRYASAPLAVFDNVLEGAKEAVRLGYADEAIYMNDDFFCLDPVGAVLPAKRNCTLAEHIAVFPANASSWWPRSLRLTAEWLAGEGYPRPDSYEAHRPFLVSPERMVWALERWTGGLEGPVPQWRTAYGVLCEVEAHPVRDAKMGLSRSGYGTPWVSTSDQSWRVYAAEMKKRFQKPSRWEI